MFQLKPSLKLLYVIHLASAVLEELVKALMENRETYRQFINLLIVPNLRTLNLSRCWKEDLLHLLPLAAKNSPVSNYF